MATSLFQDPIYRRFALQRPIAVNAQLVLQRLLDPRVLDDLFHRHAQAQTERILLFSTLTHLMASVVLGKAASVNAAFEKMRDQLLVSKTAVYEKLQRVEPQTVRELVRHSYRQVVELWHECGGLPHHEVTGYEQRILDGNHLSATEHRLTETRSQTAAPLPGKTLVVFDPRRGAVADIVPIEDGHAQERSALEALIETLQAKQLWIADRNFCTMRFLFEIAKQLGFFVIRQHGTVKGKLKGRRRFIGDGPTGRVYEQEIQLSFDDQTRTLRRITIELKQATRDGDIALHLLTNLPPKDVSALVVAELYRRRWTIETLFLEVTQTLTCEINTLCYPKAALFVFCLALVAANAVAVIKAALRAAHTAEKADELSGYYLAFEIKQVHDGMMIALPPARWRVFRGMSVPTFAKVLKKIAAHVDLTMYRKSPRGPKKPPPQKTRYRNGSHVSTHKLLADDDQ